MHINARRLEILTTKHLVWSDESIFSIIANCFPHAAFKHIVAEQWDSGCEKYCFKEKNSYSETVS